VRPLVDLPGAGLDRSGPAITGPDPGNTPGGEDAKDLLHLHAAGLANNHQVDQVVGMGKVGAREPIHRYPPVAPELLDIPPGPGDVVCIGIQALQQVALAGAERRRQHPVAASQVDHQAAPDTGAGENFLCQPIGLLDLAPPGRCRRQESK